MQAPCGIEIKVGQVWEEVGGQELRGTVVGWETRWTGRPYTARGRTLEDCVKIERTGRHTYPMLSRFNGKRGGYKLVENSAVASSLALR